eukprot:CAMPEP_0171709878 /NCGR_PEP_ID=MMETSP0991-20121206/15705_1 /TAXON_ID=483369 /ORGANISM="non described non described, Strain CCMP2098" /LENGTH=354 /DNA_ID=CAMNT_0012299999 /DNA_START=84 /DNA_END=1146 /DNA_ORIENTATION=+
MHRARAFRIFEVSVALSKNKRSVDETSEALAAIEKVGVELQSVLAENSLRDSGLLYAPPEPSEEFDDDEGSGALRRRLIAARALVKGRMAEAALTFGEEMVNRADLEEIRVLEDQLFAMACRGLEVTAEPPPSTHGCHASKAAAVQKEARKLHERLARLDEQGVFLARVFDKAYESEEPDQEIEEDKDSDDSDDDGDEEEDDEDGGDASFSKESGARSSSVASRRGTPTVGTGDTSLLTTRTRTKKRRLTVPSVSVQEASRFFLLAHMLSHLESAEGYDVHGKAFYDLTGSGGQVCAAAQYCLPDGGKLNSELGEWAEVAGLAGAGGTSIPDGSSGSCASIPDSGPGGGGGGRG